MVEIAISYATGRVRVPKKMLQRIVSLVFKKEQVAGGKISCVFVDDDAIRKLNSKYLGHTSATDVITFPIETQPFLEAEIYINVEQARRQARIFGVSLANELSRLVVHGVLHAFGYTDKRTNQREQMFELQERYVRMCGDGEGAI
jgi:rRNA maturation RNase YbeY